MPARSHSQALGQWAEEQACQTIQAAGFTMVAQNFHSRFGEIDVIAVQAQEIIFVEVKARSATRWGQAFEVVTPRKQLKIYKTALQYIQDHADFESFYYRFDVICFDFQQEIAKNLQHNFSNMQYDQQWIENAFTIDADLINL